jgi:uncharacterized protein (TIGR02145 family)
VRKLKITQTSGYVSLIPTAVIDSITHSEGQAVNPEQLGNLRTGSVFGIVRNDQGNPVPLALVKSAYSPHQTTTDINGVFILNNFVVYDKLGFITVEKEGYFKGSRSFLPLENGANRLEIQLLPKTQSGSFASAGGGQVTAGSLKLTFPANAIVQANGQPYSGTVNVFARALDPASQDMFDQMPGDLLGGLNDSLRILRSFGMAAVELLGSNNEPLQLAAGQNATLRFTIPAGMLSEAPESIDWWSFDEEAGYWKHEGMAQKTGNEYIGQAAHFSWWNCDIPINFVDLNGTVNNTEGNPISGALIEVVTPNLGTGVTYTNTEGVFTGRVPRNSNLVVNVKLTCNTTNDWALAYTQNIQTANTPLTETFTGSLENRYPITGTVVNCEGQPVNSGYVKMGSQIFVTDNGAFTIQTCSIGNYTLRAFDNSNPDSLKAGLPQTVQVTAQGVNVGNLEACNEIFDTVTDIDGNVYQTVLIGTQWWMAENLKTTRYADGSAIPNVTSNAAWTALDSGAWCNYENSAVNGAVYGKLYNWYAVADPRNVCPTGWHVPSDEEWMQLEIYLGMPPSEASQMGLRGSSANVGGQMKAMDLWQPPNTGANNSSGFSGLPGGFRLNNGGAFYYLGFNGTWWSATAYDGLGAWNRRLNNGNGGVGRYSGYKQAGYSVRCVKD